MTGQLKPYYRERDRRWAVSIELPGSTRKKRRRKHFYARTPEQAIAAAQGARSPDRVVAIRKMKQVLDETPGLRNESRRLLLEAIVELELNL